MRRMIPQSLIDWIKSIRKSDNKIDSSKLDKKIFYHGLEYYSSPNQLMYATIINNNDTPFTSANSFVNWITQFSSLVVVQCNGMITTGGESYQLYSIFKNAGDTALNFVARKIGDDEYVLINNITLSNYFTTFHDGVNQIY